MKIRNLPFKKLNKKEQDIVKRHYNYCREISLECKLHKDIKDFWEAHREADTNNGRYNGWIANR